MHTSRVQEQIDTMCMMGRGEDLRVTKKIQKWTAPVQIPDRILSHVGQKVYQKVGRTNMHPWNRVINRYPQV